MPQEHDWVVDPERCMDMNAKCTGNPFAGQFRICRCSKCGCLQVWDSSKACRTGWVVYKPMQWTWNPFKILEDEPPCPAHW